MPVAHEGKPRGGKKSFGALTTMNSNAVSSDRGRSWEMLGYTMNVSSTMLPKRIIITYRYVRMTANAIRCFFKVCSYGFDGVMAILSRIAVWPR
jgi:hypothetical protein